MEDVESLTPPVVDCCVVGNCCISTARIPKRPALQNLTNIYTGFTSTKKRLLYGYTMSAGATLAKAKDVRERKVDNQLMLPPSPRHPVVETPAEADEY
jgi:hypothetical protein